MAGRVGRGIPSVGQAGIARQSGRDRFPYLGVRRARSTPQRREEAVESGLVLSRRRQPVPCDEKVRRRLTQGSMLVAKYPEREPGVELRVVHPPPLELTVLVVLDQVVVGVARECEGVQPQRVDRGKAKQPKARLRGGEVRQVEENQVVAQNEPGAVGKVVQSGRRSPEVVAPKHEPLVAVRAYCGKGVNSAVLPTDLEVQRDVGRQRIPSSISHQRKPACRNGARYPASHWLRRHRPGSTSSVRDGPVDVPFGRQVYGKRLSNMAVGVARARSGPSLTLPRCVRQHLTSARCPLTLLS